jgi:Ca2+-binding RTX toxin-like protein
VIEAGQGDDVLDGGPGNDLLSPGKGADRVAGGDGSDTVSYAFAPRGLVIDLQGPAGSTGLGGDTLSQIENAIGTRFADKMYGNVQDNVLVGNGGADEIQGGAGGDREYGRIGRDVLFGDKGADWLDGGLGIDRCVQGAGAGTERLCERR